MTRLRQQWRTVRIVHFALMLSLGFYGLVLVVLSQTTWKHPKGLAEAPANATAASPPMAPELLLGALGAVGLIILVIVIPILQKQLLPKRDRVGSDRIDFDSPEVNDVLVPLVRKMQSGLIVTWALCESVGIFGLVAAMVFREPLYAAPFGAVALLAFLYHAPTTRFLASVYRGARR